jgi:hypothetical protein
VRWSGRGKVAISGNDNQWNRAIDRAITRELRPHSEGLEMRGRCNISLSTFHWTALPTRGPM